MGVKCSDSWNCGEDGPTTVEELRTALTALAKKKSGAKLISDKFEDDHIFAGHTGDPKKIALLLARLRGKPASSYLTGSIRETAQKEVLNWIDSVPAAKLSYAKGVWSVSRKGTAVQASQAYKFMTVELDEFKGMDPDDVVKKSRKWLTESNKKPKVACLFTSDGTPAIYHLDF